MYGSPASDDSERRARPFVGCRFMGTIVLPRLTSVLFIDKNILTVDMSLSYNDAMGKASISSLLVVVLNVCWYIVAFSMVLAAGIAVLSAFHDIGGGELDIPVSFSVDAGALPVRAPSLGVATAKIERVRGSLIFSPPPGTSLIGPALLAVVIMLAFVLFVIGQLRAVFRTLRDGRPFVPANATRLRWIGFAVIAGELARTAGIYSANSYVMSHFFAPGLRFDSRPDLSVLTIVHGLIILAIGEVFRTGTRLDEDQSLTI